MTDEEMKVLFEDLDALLVEEREALLNGDMQALAGLLRRKEDMIDTLGRLDQSEITSLEALRGRALRNQDLIDNALRGIRDVAERLSTLRRLRRVLETYDREGQRTALAVQKSGTVEKRA